LVRNSVADRLETVKAVMGRNVQTQPGILVNSSCKMLIRGMNGGYKYRKISSAQSERYDEKPEKNRFSDVQDALQYLLCGSGELRKLKGRNVKYYQPIVADTGFSVF